ncbi:MAG: gfo/Idh/MocA family oxidoreductase, partial [Lysobacteraceae bacterium]
MTDPIKLALVGVGKIARDQHIPAIQAEARFA